MQLLFVSRFYQPDSSGGYEMNCRRYAVELTRRGHDVIVLTRGYREESHEDGILVWRALPDVPPRMEMKRFQNRWYQARVALENRRAGVRMRQALARFTPDVVTFWGMNMHLVAPVLVAQQRSVPHTFDIGDYWLLESLGSYEIPDARRRRYRRWLLGGSFTAGSLLNVVVHSQFMRQQHIRVGVPAEEIEVIPRPLNEAFVSGCAATPRANGHSGEIRFLYVGRLVPDKGLHRAIEALDVLRHGPGPRLHLDIYGSGPSDYERELGRVIGALGGRCSAALHGSVPAAALPQIYRSHDALVFPAIWDEPSSNVILEAVVAGLPVVGTYSGSVPEFVAKESAILVPKDDARALADGFESIARDPGRALRAAANGSREVLERHASSRVFDAVEQQLRRVATTGRAA